MRTVPVNSEGSEDRDRASEGEGVLLTEHSALSPQHLFLDITTDLLQRAHSVRFKANGWSMRPTIADGEVITVQPVSPLEVKQGDVILYRLETAVIAHRVIRIEGSKDAAPLFILRGDASDRCDEPIQAGQVLGKVVSVERNDHRITLDKRKAPRSRTARVWASRLKRSMLRLSLPLRDL